MPIASFRVPVLLRNQADAREKSLLPVAVPVLFDVYGTCPAKPTLVGRRDQTPPTSGLSRRQDRLQSSRRLVAGPGGRLQSAPPHCPPGPRHSPALFSRWE